MALDFREVVVPKANKDRTSLKIPLDLHQQIDLESAKTRKPMYVLVKEAWELYESARTANPPEPSGTVLPSSAARELGNKKIEISDSNRTYSENTESAQAHALLELIHRSGHRIAIDAILANLHAFFVLVCSDARGREREITEIPADIAAEFPDIARDYAEALVPKDNVGGAGDRTAKGHRKRPDRRAG